jgi:CO/xanthine dehydrogenase FAD-binding subunit
VRSALSQLEVLRPRDLDEALEALHDSLASGRAVPLAGGTDLFVYLNAGTQAGRRFLDLSRVGELRGIREGDDGLRVGGSVTFSEIREHPMVRRHFPMLAAAAAEVGALQIQNRATLAGNIANASPAGDSLPVLLAHDAVVRARSVRGARLVRFETLYRGYREMALEPDELIVDVILLYPPRRTATMFRKVGTRRAQSISKVVFAGALHLDADGAADHVRIAYGSVAPTPVRAYEVEQVLLGRVPSAAAAEAALEALGHDVAPIDDIRSDREYRMAIAGNVLAQLLRRAQVDYARQGPLPPRQTASFPPRSSR